MRSIALVCAAVVVASLGVARADPPGPLYDRFCLACHGARGDGQGPASPWLWPRPRDFTQASFKWISTDDASRPARADLAATIRWGAPGTAMHGFGATLHAAEIEALVDVVLGFARLPADPAPAGPRVAAAATDEAARLRGGALWLRLGCAQCHGDDRRADDRPAMANRYGAPQRPYDLTASPVRRPRPGDDLPARVAAVIETVRHGVGGTAMPGFRLADRDALDLAAFVAALAPPAEPAGTVGDLPAIVVELDRDGHLTRGGYRPSAPDDPDGVPFGHTIELQGEPPPALAPAQASLSSRQCARCHATQVREWTGSIHSLAGSPGLLAQTARLSDGAAVESCLRCHAPLAEQQDRLRPGQRGGDDGDRTYATNAAFDQPLQHEGLTCAACHVRDWTRHGPPRIASPLLALPGYPRRELAVYERADLCVGCHQLPARLAVAGRPLLDTYREWLLGPYMPRGIQCQHCHMPNREHTWKGIHDPDTFRQGIAVAAAAARGATGIVSVRARVTNVGAGHYLPTTPTPAAWLDLELIDADGAIIPGAQASRRIGRHLRFVRGQFEEVEDTRIPPGQSLELAQGWRGGTVDRAVRARVRVRVRPDDYYEGLYRQRLGARLAPEVRAMFEAALARAEASPYVAYQEDIAISTAAAAPPTPGLGSRAAPPPSR